MRMPNAAQRKLLERAVANYQDWIVEATGFLDGRGISLETAMRWRLGVVSLPDPGHERFLSRLCIPYICKAGVVALKFRCLQDHDCKAESCKKYLCPEGQEPYLFNVCATDSPGGVIHITEGELDAITLAETLGDPVVGCPGVGVWQNHWPFHFQSFERVIAWPDGDKAGHDWAAKLRREIPPVEIVQLPPGKDLSEVYLELGPEALKELAGIEDTAFEVAHV